MSGSVSFSVEHSRVRDLNVWVVSVDWTADSGGAVTSTAFPSNVMDSIGGSYLFKVRSIPGSPAPTEGYSVSLTDADGVDILNGAGANRSAAAQDSYPQQDTDQSLYGPVFADPLGLTFNLSDNFVDSAEGTVRLFFSAEN